VRHRRTDSCRPIIGPCDYAAWCYIPANAHPLDFDAVVAICLVTGGGRAWTKVRLTKRKLDGAQIQFARGMLLKSRTKPKSRWD
jgi:hypothetical protein